MKRVFEVKWYGRYWALAINLPSPDYHLVYTYRYKQRNGYFIKKTMIVVNYWYNKIVVVPTYNILLTNLKLLDVNNMI